MGFVFAFVTAWLAVFLFYAMKKRLPVADNAFVYLSAMALGIGAGWIIAEELQLLELTEEGLPYAGFLIHRTVTVPLLCVILFNLAFNPKRKGRGFLWAAAFIGVDAACNAVLRWLGVITYHEWNIGYDMLRTAAIIAICCMLLVLYRRLERGGGGVNAA